VGEIAEEKEKISINELQKYMGPSANCTEGLFKWVRLE